MLTRIVKMEFQPEKTSTFLQNFDRVKHKIRNFEGCKHLDLLQDANNPAIFFTYSKWENLQALENYRNSELFKTVWITTKKLFRCKAQAWSVTKIDSIEN